MDTHILLIHCPDEPGLVHKITGVLYRHQLNIVSNGEFVERKYSHFFMRTEFSGPSDTASLLSALQEVLPPRVTIRLTPRKKKNVVIMVTREYHCLSDLLLRHTFDDMDMKIQAVVSNYDNLAPLVEKFNLPFHYISHEGLSRPAHEAAIQAVLGPLHPDLLVLAKYMRILSAEFVQAFAHQIINIHHSFLPAFIGANPYAQAYERGVKIIGATAHFVSDALDEGPIIAQNVLPVAHTHSAQEMAQAGRDVEKFVLARALKLVLEERVFIHRNKTVIFE